MADPRLSLRAMQRRFFGLISARQNVAEALAADGQGPDAVEEMIVGDHLSNAVDRLDVYADMYFSRLLDFLLEDFPAVAAVLGEEAFRALATDYLEAAPPDSPLGRDVGARLPAFIAQHAEGGARAWLGDLAALEWARADLFDGADADVMTFEDLCALPPETLAELSLSAIPAFRVLRLGWAVDEVWRRVEAAEPAGEPPLRATMIVVWRPEVDVIHRAVRDTAEAEVLDLLVEGSAFGVLCERLAETRAPEPAAQEAARVVAGWAREGLLRAPSEAAPHGLEVRS